MRTQKLVKSCCICSKDVEIMVDPNDLIRHSFGELIQECMPYLSIEEREMIISGICGKCFDKLF